MFLFLSIIVLVPVVVVSSENSSNQTQFANETAPTLTMLSDMPNFITVDSPGRSKEITVISTITFASDLFPIGSPGPEAVRLALERLMDLPDFLPEYKIRFELMDDLCLDEWAIHPLIDRLRKTGNESRFPVVLLSECEAKAELIPSSFVKEFNFLSHSVVENTIQLDRRRKQLSNYIGFGRRADYHYFSLIALCKQMGWTKVALVSEMDPYYDLVSFRNYYFFI